MKFNMEWDQKRNYYEGKIENKLFTFSMDKNEKAPNSIKEIISAKIAGKIEQFDVQDFDSTVDNEILAVVIKCGGSYLHEEHELNVVLDKEHFSIEYGSNDITFYSAKKEGNYPREWIGYSEMFRIMNGITNQNNKMEEDYGKIEKMIELFNLCERKDEFGYLVKEGNSFIIFENISNTRIAASENYCVFQKNGVVESVALKDEKVCFEKPFGIFKEKINFVYEDKVLEISNGKVEYRILKNGMFIEKPEPALNKKETKAELLKLYRELEKTNIIKNIEKLKEIINEKIIKFSEEEIHKLSLKIEEINL